MGHIFEIYDDLCVRSRAGISNYMSQYMWDVITCPCLMCLLLAPEPTCKKRVPLLSQKLTWSGEQTRMMEVLIHLHYNDVIMSAVASQITIVYSTVYWGANQRKKPKLLVSGLCAGNPPVTGEFPAQMANNEDNISIWSRHHVREGPLTVL